MILTASQLKKIFYTNACSLFNKLGEIKCIANYSDINIICITELTSPHNILTLSLKYLITESLKTTGTHTVAVHAFTYPRDIMRKYWKHSLYVTRR